METLPMEKAKSLPAVKDILPPKTETRPRSRSEGTPRSQLKSFEGWRLDPIAEIKPSSVQTPFYEVFNDLPLPILFDDKGKVKGIFNCFNCGSQLHRVSECDQVKDQACIHLNKDWMQQYGKGPTARSYRPPRSRMRYFEKLKEMEEDDNKNSEPLEESGLKFFDSLEEMPEIPALPLKRAKSISEMEKEDEAYRQRRRPRNNNFQNRPYRHGRDFDHQDRQYNRQGYNQGYNNYRGRGGHNYNNRHYNDRRWEPRGRGYHQSRRSQRNSNGWRDDRQHGNRRRQYQPYQQRQRQQHHYF